MASRKQKNDELYGEGPSPNRPSDSESLWQDTKGAATDAWEFLFNKGQNDFKAQPYMIGNAPGTDPALANPYNQQQEARGLAMGQQQNLGKFARHDLLAAARGEGPTAAQSELQAATDRGMAQQMALAASAQGGPAQQAAMMNQGMMNQAGVQQASAADAAALRAREQQAAQQQYVDATAQAAGIAQNQGTLDFETAAANQQAALEAQGVNAQTAQANADASGGVVDDVTGAIGGIFSDIQAKENVNLLDERRDIWREDRRRRHEAAMAPEPAAQQGGGGAGIGGILGMFSDENSKREITALEDRLAASEARADSLNDSVLYLTGEEASGPPVARPPEGRGYDMTGFPRRGGYDVGIGMAQIEPQYGPPEESPEQLAARRGRLADSSDTMGEFIARSERGEDPRWGFEMGPTTIERPMPPARDPRPARAGMMSDERSKREIGLLRDENEALRADMMATPEGNRRGLDPMNAYEWEYKDEYADMQGRPQGKRETGGIAQELAASPYYKDAVVDTPAGLALDETSLLHAGVAADAGLDKRVKDLELEDQSSQIVRRNPYEDEYLGDRGRIRERGGSYMRDQDLAELAAFSERYGSR